MPLQTTAALLTRLRAGLLLFVVLLAVMGFAAFAVFDRLADEQRSIAFEHIQAAMKAERLRGLVERRAALDRGYLLTGAESFVEELAERRREADRVFEALEGAAQNTEAAALVESFRAIDAEQRATVDRAIALRRDGRIQDAVSLFERDIAPRTTRRDRVLAVLVEHFDRELFRALESSRKFTSRMAGVLLAVSAAALVLAAAIAIRLTRDLSRALRETQLAAARLSGVVGSAMDAIVSVDERQRIVLFNEAAEKMFRVRAADARGSPLDRFIPDRFRVAHRGHVDRFAETGVSARTMGALGELRGLRADGEEFPIEATISQVRVGDERIFTAIVRDVTDRRRVAAALEAQSRLTRTVTENASLALFMLDEDHRCTYLNPAAEAMTGFRLEELRDWPLHDYVHHTRPDGTPYPIDECPIDRAAPTKALESGEDVFVRRDGSFYPVAFTASPIVQDGRAVGTVVEVRDITEEKRTHEERERLLVELRRTIGARDEFLSVASHELRTPLTTLALQTDALLSLLSRGQLADLSPEKLASRLARLRTQQKRLEELVGRLLDVSRITLGRLRLEPEDVDLAALVRDVFERHHDEFERAGSTVSLAIDGPATGRWDRPRLEQIVTNLLSNAIKYGRGKPIDVHLRGDERVSLVVRDQGIGIAPADQERIFDRFERAVSERHYGGLGLGLWITRQIVEAMGGTIRLESVPGEGSTFTVELPRGPEPRERA